MNLPQLYASYRREAEKWRSAKEHADKRGQQLDRELAALKKLYTTLEVWHTYRGSINAGRAPIHVRCARACVHVARVLIDVSCRLWYLLSTDIAPLTAGRNQGAAQEDP